MILLGHQLEGIAKDYIAYGAHRILLVDHPQLAFYRTDLFTTVISDLIREHEPEIFLVGASEFGKELAARIAKRLGVGLCANCISLGWDEQRERLIASSPTFSGNFLARIVWNTNRPYMATVSAGIFSERPYDKAARGEIVKVEKNLNEPSSKIRVITSVHEPHQTTKLEDSKVVVVGGRGVKNSEGFNSIRELALLLGGGGAGTVVAVNRDPHAPIFKIADFGVVSDALTFLPVFNMEVKNHLFREITDLYRTQVNTGRDQLSISFGQRIKKLREDHKMSVVDLAEKTGQPLEYIDQVESDSLTPPVSFLLQLSNALQIDPSHFLTDQEKIQIDGKRQESFAKRTQNYSYRTLTPGAEDKHLRAFMVTIEPREKHKIVEYKHPGEEFIFVYKGELELTLGNKVHHLTQGETIHFDSETKHKLRNIADEKCELMVTLYTP